MIDTVKIYTRIDEHIYKIIRFNSNIKCMYNKASGEVFYEIINDSLEGTYDSRLSVRVFSGSKYGFIYKNSYCLEIEGSYHKIMKGQNAFNGYYSIQEITNGFITLVENAYNITLPSLNHWFFCSADLTKCFDLYNQNNVCKYINSLRYLSYPRRNIKFFENETLYCAGDVSTLKIYNKYLEFCKNDKFKVSKFTNIFDITTKIQGFVRFECEIKKKKLMTIYNKKYLRVTLINYKDLEKVWSDEFMKILKFDKETYERVKTKEEVVERLNKNFKAGKALRLYQFFITIINDGYNDVKNKTSSTSFYRNISDLKSVGIDFSQNNFEEIPRLDLNNIIDFDPFVWQEVI